MTNATAGINVNRIRKDFPILQRKINGNPLVYFDNAATSQTPIQVINAITDYYTNTNANIHRGVHSLSQEATEAYEAARNKIKTHFNAKHAREIILTAGTTHGINLVASSFTSFLKEGDEIIISALEHHSNIVPWQMLAERTAAKIRVIPINKKGELKLDIYSKLINDKTKLVFVNHVSNALGTINPIKKIIAQAHQVGAVVLIDGAQACPHIKIDVQDLDADFYVASAHKMYGPTGIGFLYGKEEWLEKLPPYQGGGEMISDVTFDKSTYADIPHKFEAGTPNIAGAIAFGVAIDYINKIGLDTIAAYENELLAYSTQQLKNIEGLKLYGTAKNKVAVVSFNIERLHPYDIGTLLDKMGIAVRTGHHCAQPIMDFYNIPGTIRASFSFYNTKSEIDILVAGIKKAKQLLA